MRTLTTDRLTIRRMSAADAGFVLALLNEPSWLRFIGDRGVRTIADATNYILQGPVEMYASLGFGLCIVESRESAHPMGICGLAKREYLDCADIGFAFLPQHCGKGYAHEAAAAVLSYATSELGLKRVVATTRVDNANSQRLLERLGLRFERVIEHPDGDRKLKLYATTEQDRAEASAAASHVKAMPQAEVAALNTKELWLEALPIARILWPELETEAYVRSLESMSARGYVLFGLRHGGTLVAIAGVQEIELLARGKALWLFDMATHPQHQAQGFGSQLLGFLREHARSNGYSRLLLHTSSSREATIAFYRSQLGEPFGVVFRAVTGKPDA